jgi:hypothetical protein
VIRPWCSLRAGDHREKQIRFSGGSSFLLFNSLLLLDQRYFIDVSVENGDKPPVAGAHAIRVYSSG